MLTSRIRPIVICLFLHNEHILVAEEEDKEKKEVFYRPLGGGIEYGEYSKDALVREIKEEINEEVKDLKYLATIENIFTFRKKLGHEIVQVYDGKLKNEELYQKEKFIGFEKDNGWGEFVIKWKSYQYFIDNPQTPLYPEGLLEIVKSLIEK